MSLQKGFRECLQSAVRSDEDVDWSCHVIDYARFKQRLKFFARRRSQIRTMIHNTEDQKLAEEVLRDLCGPKQKLRSAKKIAAQTEEEIAAYYQQMPLSQNLSEDPHAHVGLPNVVSVPSSSGDHYVEMSDGNNYDDDEPLEASMDENSMSSTGGPSAGKRRNQRSIMRRLSISERNEIIIFLEWEVRVYAVLISALTWILRGVIGRCSLLTFPSPSSSTSGGQSSHVLPLAVAKADAAPRTAAERESRDERNEGEVGRCQCMHRGGLERRAR